MIGLVGCGKAKRSVACKARELYTGNLFRLSLAYALERCEVVYIVSAKHGLVELDQVLEPYEQSLRGVTAADRCAWARSVWGAVGHRHQLRGGDLVSCLVLVGQLYAEPLLGAGVQLGLNVELLEPLRGMPIGRRLSFLAGAPEWSPRLRPEIDENGEIHRFVGGA